MNDQNGPGYLPMAIVTSEDFVKAIEGFWDKLSRVNDIVSDDRNSLMELQGKIDDDLWRRTLIRHLFAEVEARIYGFAQALLVWGEFLELSRADFAILNEESYRLDQKGCAISAVARRSLAERFHHLFNLYHLKGPPFFECSFQAIDRSSEGWRWFKEAIDIRDRLTHPRTTQDLTVDDAKMERIERAFEWIDSYLFGIAPSPNFFEELLDAPE